MTLLFFLFWHMRLLFFISFFLLWQIIFHYCSYHFFYFRLWQDVCTQMIGLCWPEELGMSDKCTWRRPGHMDQLEAAHTEWKAAWWSVPELSYALFFRLYTLLFLADQICGCCRYGTADLFTTIRCYTKLREHQVSFHCSPKRPNCSVFAH